MGARRKRKLEEGENLGDGRKVKLEQRKTVAIEHSKKDTRHSEKGKRAERALTFIVLHHTAFRSVPKIGREGRHLSNPTGTKSSHRGPQLGPSPRRGQSCLCGADGAVPVATSVPTAQSGLLFHGHEKLSWMVEVSHCKCRCGGL